MIRLCDYILSADENIRFAMHIDPLANIQCQKSIGLYTIPHEAVQKLADTVAVLTTGVLKALSQCHGCFQHITISHQNYTTVAKTTKQGILIYVTAERITPETIGHIKETISIYEKEEL